MIIQFIAYCQWLLSRPAVMGKLLNGNVGGVYRLAKSAFT